MTLFVFFSWIIVHTLILNIAIKAGWNFDPGYIGPMLIILIINITLALYGANSKNKS
jgi:hypothetical protein